MKKYLFMMMSVVLIALLAGCGSDDEQVDVKLVEIYDPVFQVSYYNQDPGLQFHQNHWVDDHCYEMTPQKEPPYILLVQWNSDKGKKALDYITSKDDGVVLSRQDLGYENMSLIICRQFILCPYFYVSSSYQFSDGYFLENEFIRIDSRILLKMKEGKSMEAIFSNSKYFEYLIPETYNKLDGVYTFRCKLRFSCQVLQLAEEIHLRDDVEWAEPSMMTPIFVYRDKELVSLTDNPVLDELGISH